MGGLFAALTAAPVWLVLPIVFALPALEASTLLGVVVAGVTAVLVGGVLAHQGKLPLPAVVVPPHQPGHIAVNGRSAMPLREPRMSGDRDRRRGAAPRGRAAHDARYRGIPSGARRGPGRRPDSVRRDADRGRLARCGRGAAGEHLQQRRTSRFLRSDPRLSRVAQLLIPVGTSLGGEVEQVPDRFDGAGVAWILSGVGWRVEQFRAPEVADHPAIAPERVQHRPP